MAKRYAHSTTITADRAVGCFGHRVTQTLVSGGTFDRLFEGRLQAVERDELVKSTAQHGFVPAISRCAIPEGLIIIIGRNKSNIEALRTRS